MKISELIKQLEAAKAEHGDIETRCLTISHAFPPEPVVRDGSAGHKYLVLNP